MLRRFGGWLLLSALLLGACEAGDKAAPTAGVPTPTLSPLFRSAVAMPTAEAVPLATSRPSQPEVSPTPDTRIREEAIFGDRLAAGWSLEQSWDVQLDSTSSRYVYGGATSLAVTALEDYGAVFFTLGEDAPVTYRRDQVLGISFWLNAGEGQIETSDLAVTVLGSNDYTFWEPDDRSVRVAGRITDGSGTFSETRLYYLGINRTIPPDTWVEVVLWLDERIYDPQYTYVTGVYIKQDAGFRQTYYVDNLRLLLVNE